MDDADALRRKLAQSIEDLVLLGEGSSDDHVAAFRTFARAVQHASSGRLAKPADLLAQLDKKVEVITLLLTLSNKRKILRAQVAATISLLLHVDSWREAVTKDARLCSSLPAEIQHDFQLSSATTEGPSPSSTATAESVPAAAPPPASTIASSLPQPGASPAEVEASLKLLKESVAAIRQLNYNAADKNAGDIAMVAFEQFRKAVTWTVHTKGNEDDIVLASLEPKDPIMEFLTDFYDNSKKHRLRVASVFTILLAFPEWHAAAERNGLLHPAVRHLLVKEETVDDNCSQKSNQNTSKATPDLAAEASSAMAQGSEGMLYIRAIAGHNLVNKDAGGEDLSDPFVRITVDGKTKRSQIVCDCVNPVWNSAPFLFSVPAGSVLVQIDVLDSDITSDDGLGSIKMRVDEVPIRSDPSALPRAEQGQLVQPSRHKLEGVPHGELELELLYCTTATRKELPMPKKSCWGPACKLVQFWRRS